jgi:hypothetical protein
MAPVFPDEFRESTQIVVLVEKFSQRRLTVPPMSIVPDDEQVQAVAEVSRSSRWLVAATKKYPYRKGDVAVATQLTADDWPTESACS